MFVANWLTSLSVAKGKKNVEREKKNEMKIGAFPLKFCLPADVIISDVLRSFNFRGVDSIGSGKKGNIDIPVCLSSVVLIFAQFQSQTACTHTHERKFRYIFSRFKMNGKRNRIFEYGVHEIQLKTV